MIQQGQQAPAGWHFRFTDFDGVEVFWSQLHAIKPCMTPVSVNILINRTYVTNVRKEFT